MILPTRIPVAFYRTASGNEPVREWFWLLARGDRKIVGVDLLRVQEQWPIGMPVCRSLGRGLWEVRSHLAGARTSRVIFCFRDGRLVLLHAFIKKSQKTPQSDLELARSRMKEVAS